MRPCCFWVFFVFLHPKISIPQIKDGTTQLCLCVQPLMTAVVDARKHVCAIIDLHVLFVKVLFHEDGSVKGIATNDVGIAKDGSPKVL